MFDFLVFTRDIRTIMSVSEHGTEEVFEELTPTPDHRDKDMITNSRKISANICTGENNVLYIMHRLSHSLN